MPAASSKSVHQCNIMFSKEGLVQVDVARIGGITPWLKTAHLAECFNVKVAPHFLMELHLSLCCAVPNALILEYIPQLDRLTTSRVQIEDGCALAPSSPGLGIDWDDEAIDALTIGKPFIMN